MSGGQGQSIVSSSSAPRRKRPPPPSPLPAEPGQEHLRHGLRTTYSPSPTQTPPKRVARVDHELFGAGHSRRAVVATPSTIGSCSPTLTSSPLSAASLSVDDMAGPVAQQRTAAMQRTLSMESSASSVSMPTGAARANANNTMRGAQDPAAQPTVASLIAASGSAEAALQKLLGEKQQLTSHNAQLWRLVEKQRSMVLGLNKDLEKMTKEKERYKRKLKEHLTHGESMSSIVISQPSRPDDRIARDDSESPLPVDKGHAMLHNTSIGVRKPSDTSEVSSVGPGRSDTPQDLISGHLARLPSTPRSASGPLAAGQVAEPLHGLSLNIDSSPNSINSNSVALDVHSPSAKVTALSPDSQPASVLASPKTRKAPPAPLKLNREPDADLPSHVDASDSEYEFDADGARVVHQERGRRKTRADDDREREKSRQEEEEHRSRSKKDKKSKSRPVEPPQLPPTMTEPATVTRAMDVRAKAPMFQGMVNPADIVRNRVVSDMQRNMVVPSLLSPGLPMSPRPGDRPLGSPMPRAPNTPFNSIPMSPKAGMAGLPLSPRAPRQPIPLPPQTPLAISYPHLDRAIGYHQQVQHQPPTVVVPNIAARSKEGDEASSDLSRESPATPNEIFMGFVSDAYPELLLPPNALPSIYVRTASSRMKPSRQSFIAPRTGEDNPVFTLAVYERSANKQLWRVEKTYASLAQLDTQIKAVCTAQVSMPEKNLFVGHAPSKIDARRQAIDQYLERTLDSIYEERAAHVVCTFLSTDAFGAENAHFSGSESLAPPEAAASGLTQPRLRQNRSGYLTKRGKNFGGWKARYFVLDGPNLKYFEGPGGAQMGSIKLQNAQIGKQSSSTTASSKSEGKDGDDKGDDENQYRHAFLILEPKKKDSSSLVRHVLCAESDEERDAWVESLLQYVDFKDDEEAAFRGVQAQVWKSEISGAKSPRLQKSLNDLKSPGFNGPNGKPFNSNLRVGNYSEMIAGEAPIMGGPPLSPRLPQESSSPVTGSAEKFEGHFGAAHPTISGPTNLQVIQNTGDWGLKTSALTPGVKGEKKRSVFQLPFSNKGRSSSDLAPAERGMVMTGAGSASDARAAGVRPVFGIDLSLAVEFAPAPVDHQGNSTDLPAIVYRCIEYLTIKNAATEEGIFRLSGSNTVIKMLKERFNVEGDVDLLGEEQHPSSHSTSNSGPYDVHAVASLLKLYLRELPTSILTKELLIEFLRSLELQLHEEKIKALNVLVRKLPLVNRALVESLAGLMSEIVDNVAVNRMNVRNLGVVFAPTLNLPGPLISLFVEEKARIFGPPIIDETESPLVANNHLRQQTALAAASIDLRSPRKQMFSDLPTPAYNQTSFQSFHPIVHNPSSSYNENTDTGMIPVHPTYAAYQMAPQGEGGFGSLNDALRSQNLYQPSSSAQSDIGLTQREIKARRRESGMLPADNGSGYTHQMTGHTGMSKKSSLPNVGEEQGTRF